MASLGELPWTWWWWWWWLDSGVLRLITSSHSRNNSPQSKLCIREVFEHIALLLSYFESLAVLPVTENVLFHSCVQNNPVNILNLQSNPLIK